MTPPATPGQPRPPPGERRDRFCGWWMGGCSRSEEPRGRSTRTPALGVIRPHPLPRAPRRALLLPSGLVAVAGLGFLDLYDPEKDQWIPWIRDRSFDPDAILGLRDGRILVVDTRSRRTRILDPETRRGYPAARPRIRRSAPMAVTLEDGRVLVGGGFVATYGPDVYSFSAETLRATELYQPPPPRPRLSSMEISGEGRSRSVAFTLNEAATVRMALARRVGGAWRTVRTAPARRGRFGRNRFGLRSALRLPGLTAGRYHLTLRSRDPFDRTARPVTLDLRLS